MEYSKPKLAESTKTTSDGVGRHADYHCALAEDHHWVQPKAWLPLLQCLRS